MAEKINIGTATQYLFDRCCMAEDENIGFEINPARKAGLVLGPERPWEAYRIAPHAILKDEGVFKMWYGAVAHYRGAAGDVACPRCNRQNPGRNIVCRFCGWPMLDIDYLHANLLFKCFAISTDGVHWERPDLGLVEFNGSRKNNIIPFTGSICSPSINPLGPPEEKFMAVSEYDGKLYVSVSPDGLCWTRKPNPVLPFSADTSNQIIYDPLLNKYVAFLRGFPGRRTVVRCEFESLDQSPWPFTDWGHRPDKTGTVYITDELETVLDIDGDDPQLPGLDINHLSATRHADGCYLGFPGLFRKYPPGGLDSQGRENHRYFAQGNDGTFETQLAVSRDGRKWFRPDRRPYVRNGIYGKDLDGGLIIVAPGIVQSGETLSQYYGGFSVTHGMFRPGDGGCTGRIFRLEQEKDRFIAVKAGARGGCFLTPILIHSCARLELNVDCQGLGEVVVQIRGAEGNPLAGFSCDDCDPIDLNHLSAGVSWRGKTDLRSLAGIPVRLEFFLRQARLFTFRFSGMPH